MSFRKKSHENRSTNHRQQKTRSLIVPSTIVSDSSECGSPSPELKHRFSFRNFRRGRSLSKSRCSSPMPNDGDTVDDANVRSGDEYDDRIDTPATSPTASPSIRKSSSVVDFRSFCTKLHRHLTAGKWVGFASAKRQPLPFHEMGHHLILSYWSVSTTSTTSLCVCVCV